mgnify:CR=1 FL=1
MKENMSLLRVFSFKNCLMVSIGVLISLPIYVLAKNQFDEDKRRLWVTVANCIFVERSKVSAIVSPNEITGIVDSAIEDGRCSVGQ